MASPWGNLTAATPAPSTPPTPNVWGNLSAATPSPSASTTPTPTTNASPWGDLSAAPAASPLSGVIQKGVGALQTVGNLENVPMAYAEAGLKDIGENIGDPTRLFDPNRRVTSTDQVTQDLQSGGISKVNENDIYFHEGSLRRVLQDPNASPASKAMAQHFLDNPWQAGLADFATEFANPSNIITGGLGKAVGAVGEIPRVAQSLDELQALGKFGNRFAGLRVAARDIARQKGASATDQHLAAESAEQWGRGLVAAPEAAKKRAFEETQNIFGGLTKDQQFEVVHRMQTGKLKDFGPLNGVLDQRAALLKQHLNDITNEQLEAGTLGESKVFNRSQFFPMAGAYNHLSDDDEWMRFVNPDEQEKVEEFLGEHRSGASGVGIRKGTGGENAPRRRLATLRDSMTNPNRTLRDSWTPAESYQRFLAQRGKNVAVENSIKGLMEKGAGLAQPLDELGNLRNFAPASAVSSINKLGSPYLKDKALHEQLVNFLEDAGASSGDGQAFAHATTEIGKLMNAIPKAYNVSQSILRQGVVFNPIVHVVWNLGFQYLAAGGSLKELPKIIKNITADVARSHGGTKAFESVVPEGSTEAEQAGAILPRAPGHEIGGVSSTGTPLQMRPGSDLTLREKAAKFAGNTQEANQRLVFDIGERHIAHSLYDTFRKRMGSAEASNMVRKTLGDYANVRNQGIDRVLKSVFFFYPWLKTILPFWIKTGATKPQAWNAPMELAQTHNELAGDPNARTDAENPYAIYTGDDKTGHPEYFDAPAPQRILDPAVQLAEGTLSGDAKTRASGFKRLFGNRLNPTADVVASTLGEIGSPEQQATGLLGYAPPIEKLKQVGESLKNYIPGPIQGVVDLVNLFKSKTPPAKILGEFIGGIGFAGQTPAQKAQSHAVAREYYRLIDNALKNNNQGQAWTYYQQMENALHPQETP